MLNGSEDSIRWSGACVDGKASGYGLVRRYEDGIESERNEGHFVGGKLNGYAVWTRQGHRYEGGFVDHKFHGRGLYIWPSGARYEGEFADDKQHGRGIHSVPGGARYKGPFVKGKKHGVGLCYTPGKDEYVCRWNNGVRVDGFREA